MAGEIQLDLFGVEQAKLDDAQARAVAQATWQQRFDRADWVAPYDCGLGPTGTVVHGWRCPACATVEPTAFTLSVNHGLDPECRPHHPNEALFSMCVSMRLRNHHENVDTSRPTRAA